MLSHHLLDLSAEALNTYLDFIGCFSFIGKDVETPFPQFNGHLAAA